MKERIVKFSKMDDVCHFVKAAGECDFEIDLIYQHIYIDAKSFLGVVGVGLSKEIKVKYSGRNSKFETVIANLAVA